MKHLTLSLLSLVLLIAGHRCDDDYRNETRLEEQIIREQQQEEEEKDEGGPCPLHLSRLLPESELRRFDNGSLLHDGLIYPEGSYWQRSDNNETRGCICSLPGKFCLRKCCGPNELVSPSLSRSNSCAPAKTGQRDDRGPPLRVNPERASRELRDSGINDLRDRFAVFSSPSCGEGYGVMRLDPDRFAEDVYELQANGSLWVNAQGLLPAGRFCVDRQLGGDELAVLACLARNAGNGGGGGINGEDLAPTPVRLGCLLSVPFLAVTLVVYAIIPELRNIYGKTLMCYVVALLTAYTSISMSNFFFFGFWCLVTGRANKRSALSSDESSIQCGNNEFYNSCGSDCEMTCDILNNDDHLAKRCGSSKSGCHAMCDCEVGYVRENANGKCIREQECPRVKH